MEKLQLIKPSIRYQESYLDFYQEWKETGEPMVPFVISKDPTHFGEMIDELEKAESGENIYEGWVRNSTFWLVNPNGKVIGAVNIRHQLTEKLFNEGGHIGYGIRPTERKKGYAHIMLQLALVEAGKLGIDKALVVCDETNVASERTIILNGGVADSDFMKEKDHIIKRYWITIE
ncbi:GNAT family N-acetyltransferase [Alkalihalobacillus pseudalcaliphilus]|uniref:GNAT family N-acetyltransferase n=1 Tax=Alkalihalobacillus pseudalcaliphilus TaxID=79884 RepID=UPI00064DA27F|nr:GNAT family N-acetyltransferase [Alkalihalobacillus pseudalcaliphilus]KMK74646.1 GCN5 family acetyltransferase [Alkalihalobacillus pseudalcaliphilus]